MSSFVLPLKGGSFTGAFTSANLPRTELLSSSDILRAALMVGRTRRDAVRFGAQSWMEALWRVSTIRLGLNLEPPPAGLALYLRRHQNWGRLDRSERGVLNYACGNLVAKLVAERVLDAPLLLHHDVYSKFIRSPLGPKEPRPDFLAWSPQVAFLPPHYSPWIALEAKGRTRFPRSPQSGARIDAKRQSEALTHVRGERIAVHVVCWSYERGGILQAFYEDPAPERDGLRVNISDDEFVSSYYAPVAEVLRVSQVESQNRDSVTYAVPAFDLRLAVHHKLNILLREPQEMSAWLNFLPQIAQERAFAADTPLGPDGIAVLPGESWFRRQR